MSRRLSNWLDTWLLYLDNSEPPILYHKWTALSILAAALERKVFLQWHAKVYANLYIVLVGPAGKVKKGTAMAPGLSMLRRLENLTIAAEASTKEAIVNLLFSTANSSFIHPSIPDKMFNYSALTIFSEELTVFLGYNNVDLMSWLCDWYDCRPDWTYLTKTSGKQELSNIWVNLIGATTPSLLQSTMSTDLIGGGLASRTIFVYEEKKRKTVTVPFAYNADLQMFDLTNHDLYEEDLYHDLLEIQKLNGQFRFTQKFLDYWVYFYTSSKPPVVEDPRMDTYRTRRPVHFLKLSMLMNVARSDDMLIDEIDGQSALELLEQTEQKMHMSFAGMGRNEDSEIVNEIQLYIGLQKKVQFNDILRRFHFDTTREKLITIISSLIAIGYCYEEDIKGSKPKDWWIIFNEKYK